MAPSTTVNSVSSAGAAPTHVAYNKGTRLAGKVALISGGGRGMGASHARAIVAQGGKVALGDIQQCDEEGQALVKELGVENAIYFRLDVRDRAQWAEAVKKTVDTFGKLNVLILNAGIVNGGSIERYKDQAWDDMVSSQLWVPSPRSQLTRKASVLLLFRRIFLIFINM